MKNNKNEILLKALTLFSQTGYNSVSMDQIAKAVGIKAPSIYNHYKSKIDLFENIILEMQKMDSLNASDNGMPDGTYDEIPQEYNKVNLLKIKEYSKIMFRHWTTDDFSSKFRKMLTLDQYNNPKIALLYQQYLSTGPTEYMCDIFNIYINDRKIAYQKALEFYAPMFLMYNIYDNAEDKETVLNNMDNYIDNFIENFKNQYLDIYEV